MDRRSQGNQSSGGLPKAASLPQGKAASVVFSKDMASCEMNPCVSWDTHSLSCGAWVWRSCSLVGLFFNSIAPFFLCARRTRDTLLGVCWALPMETLCFPVETVSCALGLLVPVDVPTGHCRSSCSSHEGLGCLRGESFCLQGNGSRSGLPSHWMGRESYYSLLVAVGMLPYQQRAALSCPGQDGACFP